MLGIRFAHFDSMMHVIVYKNEKIRRQGRGLSFYYFAPTTSIVAVRVGTAVCRSFSPKRPAITRRSRSRDRFRIGSANRLPINFFPSFNLRNLNR